MIQGTQWYKGVSAVKVPSNQAPDVRWLFDRISVRSRIGLGEAMRLRNLGLPPFLGATVFILDEEDSVEAVGCTERTDPISVPDVLAALRLRLAA